MFTAPSPPKPKEKEAKKERTMQDRLEDLKRLEQGLPQSFQQKFWEDEDKITDNERIERSGVRTVKLSSIPLWKDDKRNVPTKSSLYPHNAELNAKVALYRGDITRLEIDGVVNAANQSLLGGGGIDGAIHSASGSQLRRECKEHEGCDTGQSKITRAYLMPSKYIIHTVGPIGENPEKLTSCYKTILDLAARYKVRTIALCGVSTGIYGYPLRPASEIALKTVREWLEANPDKLDLVVVCTFLAHEEVCYTNLFPLYFPAEGSELLSNQSASDETVEEDPNSGKNDENPSTDVEKTAESLQSLKVEGSEINDQENL